MGTIYIILTFIFIAFFASGLKIVPEGSRYVIYNMGRKCEVLLGGRTPLIFIWPFIQQGIKIAVGQSGVLISDETADFNELVIGIKKDGEIKLGDRVQIIGFDQHKAIIKRHENGTDPN